MDKSLRVLVVLLSLAYLPITVVSGLSYDLMTHERTTGRAFDLSLGVSVYLDHLGISRSDIFDFKSRTPSNQLADFVNTGTLRDWIIEGAIREDDFRPHLGCPQPLNPPSEIDRPLHHFFDSQRGGRGLTTPLVNGLPATDWALGGQGHGLGQTGNQFSILDARVYQLRSLTESKKEDREQNAALLFRTLGQVAHVLQDMAQPQHTRNNPHSGCIPHSIAGERSWYEAYIETRALGERFRTRGQPASPLLLDGYTTPRFTSYQDFWTTAGRQGLADFSSRNFFSAGTNLSTFGNCGGLAEPLCDRSAYIQTTTPFSFQAVDGKTISGEVTLFLGKVQDHLTGQTIPNVAVSSRSVWDQHLESHGFAPRFSLNTLNYDSISELLIPRAVGYSAGLLDYFFRGKLDMDLIPDGDDPSLVRLSGTNGSPDKLDGGTLTLYADDPVTGLRAPVNTFTVIADAGQPIETGNFQINSEAERFMAVYKGKLGNELPQGDFPGGVIGKALGGVRVEEVFTDFNRWYLRTPKGVYPMPFSFNDVPELRWGDKDNTLVGLRRFSESEEEINQFFVFQINRPEGSMDIPLHMGDDGTDVVDINQLRDVSFLFGRDLGTNVRFTETFHHQQFIPWAISTTVYNWIVDEPGDPDKGHYEVQETLWEGQVNGVSDQTARFDFTVRPMLFRGESFNKPYFWFIEDFALARNGRILAQISVQMNTSFFSNEAMRPPDIVAKFPQYSMEVSLGAPGSEIPRTVASGLSSHLFNFGGEGMGVGGTLLFALIDVETGEVLASTAPPDLIFDFKTAATIVGQHFSDELATRFRREKFANGPRNGEFKYVAVSGGKPQSNDPPVCPPDVVNQPMMSFGEVNRESISEASMTHYRPELAQLVVDSSTDIHSTSAVIVDCGSGTPANPPRGFRVNYTTKKANVSSIVQVMRPRAGAEPVLVMQGPIKIDQPDDTSLATWAYENGNASVRHQLGPGFHRIKNATPNAALVNSFIFTPTGFDFPQTLVSFENSILSKSFPEGLPGDFIVLEPDFIYNKNDTRFYTKQSSPRITALPAPLAPASFFALFGEFHALRLR